jgi:hypothetical protein
MTDENTGDVDDLLLRLERGDKRALTERFKGVGLDRVLVDVRRIRAGEISNTGGRCG